MIPKFLFLNTSLKALLSTVSDSFDKARIKILFTILIFSTVKLLVIIPIVYQNGQFSHLNRALAMLVVYIILFIVLLKNKKYTLPVAHIMAWMGLVLIWSILFVFAKAINIILLQFVFMLILCSFCLLNKFYGIIYSAMATIPVVIFLISGGNWGPNLREGEMAASASGVLIILNFITIVFIHYLYQEAISSNIKEKEDLNERLQLAFNEANLAVQSKSDFLSTMSHELRTPLISVIGMSELLLAKPNNAEQEENLKILNFSALSLHSLVNDILDYNKLGLDKLHLETVTVNLEELIQEICGGMRVQARDKGLTLNLNIDDRLKDEHVITDPTRISQIIYNLTGNAIKFTAQGEVSVNLEMLHKDQDKVHVRFSVIDTGIGIGAEEQGKIFEPFTQASSSTTRIFGGTGLGLAIVKRLLTLFDSNIMLESTPGMGSNFFFDMLFERDKIQPDIPSLQESVYDLSGLRILVAEDNSMNRTLLKKVLSNWNNEPEFATNGQEATEKLMANEFDIVLMDIHMPLMDGYEASRIVRQMADPSRSSIPIIALTASVSNNLYLKIQEAGMNDFIYKPFKTTELYTKIKQVTQHLSKDKLGV